MIFGEGNHYEKMQQIATFRKSQVDLAIPNGSNKSPASDFVCFSCAVDVGSR